jgi:hypothetical protein
VTCLWMWLFLFNMHFLLSACINEYNMCLPIAHVACP